MKKLIPTFFYTLALYFGVSTLLFAQEAPVNTVLADFQSQTFPSNVTTIDADGNAPNPNSNLQISNWAVVQLTATNFVAVSNSWFEPLAQADDWMIFQDVVVDTGSLRNLLLFKAQSINPGFLETMELHIDTGNSAEIDNFELVNTIDQVSPNGLTQYFLDVTQYAGDTISVAFRNVSDDKLYLLVDDVVMSNVNSAVYAETSSAYNKTYASADNELEYFQNIENLGANNITSLTYTVNNGSEEMEITEDNLDIIPITTETVSLTVPAEMISGPSTTLDIELTHVNGVEFDFEPEQIKYSVLGSGQASEKLALGEMFTSSSCPPCQPGNVTFQGIVDNEIDQEVHYIKYQQNFPGVGDPYTTDELIERRNYYGVNSIPNFRVDGVNYAINPNGMDAASYEASLNRPGFVEFDDVSYEIDSHTVTVTGTYTILSEVLPNTHMMAAIHEDTTFNNMLPSSEGGNGETEFYHVVKKLIGGNSGMEIDPSTPMNEPQDFEMSYTFNGDYRLPVNGQAANRIDNSVEHSVEEFSDLEVSVWIENKDVNFILNSAKGELQTTSVNKADAFVNEMNVFPSPAMTQTNLQLKLKKRVDADIYIVNMNGQRVNQLHSGNLNKGVNTFQADVSNLPSGQYIVELRGKNLYKGIPLIITH